MPTRRTVLNLFAAAGSIPVIGAFMTSPDDNLSSPKFIQDYLRAYKLAALDINPDARKHRLDYYEEDSDRCMYDFAPSSEYPVTFRAGMTRAISLIEESNAALVVVRCWDRKYVVWDVGVQLHAHNWQPLRKSVFVKSAKPALVSPGNAGRICT